MRATLAIMVVALTSAVNGLGDLRLNKDASFTVDITKIDYTSLTSDVGKILDGLNQVDRESDEDGLVAINDASLKLRTRLAKENVSQTALSAPCGAILGDCGTYNRTTLLGESMIKDYGVITKKQVDIVNKLALKKWLKGETTISGLSTGYHEGQPRCCIRKVSSGCECMSDDEGGCGDCYDTEGLTGETVETLGDRRRGLEVAAVIEFGRPKFGAKQVGNVTFTTVKTPRCSLDGTPGEPGLPLLRKALLGMCGYEIERIDAVKASGEFSEVQGPLLPYEYEPVDGIVSNSDSRLWFDDNNFELKPKGLTYNITQYLGYIKKKPPVCTTRPMARKTPQCGILLECKSGRYENGVISMFKSIKVSFSSDVKPTPKQPTLVEGDVEQVSQSQFNRKSVLLPKLPSPGPLVDAGEFVTVNRAANKMSKHQYFDVKDSSKFPSFHEWFLGFNSCTADEIGRTLTKRLRKLFDAFGLNHKLPSVSSLKKTKIELTSVISSITQLQSPPLWTASPRPDLDCTICYGAQMLVITTDALEEAAQEFATFKRSLGMSVNVAVMPAATVSSANLDAMRGWADLVIESRYHFCDTKLEYVVLFADSDSIPAWTLSSTESDGTVSLLGTDYFYGLVGVETDQLSTFYTMQSDGDLPLWPEIQVGRISADSVEEGLSIVERIKTFESNPASIRSSYYKTALLAAYFELDEDASEATAPLAWDDRGYIRSTELVRDIMTNHGKESDRIYTQTRNSTRFIPQWHDDGSLVSGDIKSIMTERSTDDAANKVRYGDGLKSGRFAFFHRDHGSRNGLSAPSLQISDLPTVIDPESPPTVMFNLNCQSGRYDNENGHGCSGCSDSFAEEAMVTPGGPAAVIAGSRNTGTGSNNALIETLGTSIFLGSSLSGSRSYLELGWLMNTAKWLLVDKRSASSVADQKAKYNLFGDPSTKMWINPPKRFPWLADLVTDIELVPEFIPEWSPLSKNVIFNAVEIKLKYIYDNKDIDAALHESVLTASLPLGTGRVGLCGKRSLEVVRRWTVKNGAMLLRTPEFATKTAQADFLRDLRLTLALAGGERVPIDALVYEDSATLKCCATNEKNSKLCKKDCVVQPKAATSKPSFFKDGKSLQVGNVKYHSAGHLVGRMTGFVFEQGDSIIIGEKPKKIKIDCTVKAYEACNDDNGVVIIAGSECSCVKFPKEDPTEPKEIEGLNRRDADKDDLKIAIKNLKPDERADILNDIQEFSEQNKAAMIEIECARDKCNDKNDCSDEMIELANLAKNMSDAGVHDSVVYAAAVATAEASKSDGTGGDGTGGDGGDGNDSDDDNSESDGSSGGSDDAALIAGIVSGVCVLAIVAVVATVMIQRGKKNAATSLDNPGFESFEHRTSQVAIDVESGEKASEPSSEEVVLDISPQ